MKKIILLFMALVLAVLISIPKVYALDPMPTGYFRSNTGLTKLYDGQNANGTIIRYQTDPNYIYDTILATNNLFESIIVVLTDTDLTTQFQQFLVNNNSIEEAINILYTGFDADTFDLIWFRDYSDDDLRTKLIFPLTKQGGQDYVYVFTTELVSYASSSLFYISNVSYNQYMEYLMFSNQQYQSGYNNARQQYGYYSGGNWYSASQRYDMGYNTAKNEFGLRGGVFGNADYWFSQGQLNDLDIWGSLLSAFFGIFQVLNIQILPGVQLGYFVGFFLVLGVASMIIGSFMIRRK